MNNWFHKTWTKYQKTMWYVAQAGTEIGKPLRFYSETALLLLLLDKFGVHMKWYSFILLYFSILVIAYFAGRFLARNGTIRYNTTLSNNHNEELQQILSELQRLKKQ